jgi:hypothetical protein
MMGERGCFCHLRMARSQFVDFGDGNCNCAEYTVASSRQQLVSKTGGQAKGLTYHHRAQISILQNITYGPDLHVPVMKLAVL